LKIEAQINEKGEIINISKSYGGRKHDFAVRKAEKPTPREATILADSGYQGLQKKNKKAILPHNQ
jgi:hypothetical protein